CTSAVVCNPCAGQGAGDVAQVQQPETEKLPTPGSDLTLTLSAGYEHIFNMNLDSGDVSIDRAGIHFQARGSVTRDIRLECNFRYLYDHYDCSDAFQLDPLGGDPWNDLNTFAFDATMEWWLNNDIALLLGLTVESSRELGASWSKSVTGGGRFGMLFIANK